MLAILSTLLIYASPVLWWCLPEYDRGGSKGTTFVALFGLGLGIQIYLNRLLIYFYVVGGYFLP